MRLLTADEGAWGVSDSVFFGGFVIAALLLTTLSLIVRRRVSDGHGLRRELHPHEVAYLIGGPRRTIATALAGLYADGAIDSGRRGHLRATGTPAVMSAPLDLAIHGVIREQVLSARQLEAEPEVRQAVGAVRDTLVGDGLASGPGHRTKARLAVLPLVALLVVGVLRLRAGPQDGRPAILLVVAMTVLAVLTATLLLRTPPRLRSGAAAVEAVRSRSRYLDPSVTSAWTTHGPAGAALGVALFGAAALSSIDPGFARAARLQRQLASGTSSSGASGVPGHAGGTWRLRLWRRRQWR